VQLSDNELPGVPPTRLALSAQYDLPRNSWFEVESEWTDGYWANDFNGPPPGSDSPPRGEDQLPTAWWQSWASGFFNDSYTTVAVRVGGAADLSAYRAHIFAGIDNLFDRRYNGSVTPNASGNRFFEPAAGRTWHAGITLEVGN
jgi:iron complex outermembrane receptor protein